MRGRIVFGLAVIASFKLYASPQQVITEANKEASLEPARKNFFNAGMIFDWEQGRLYQVYTQPERITDIAFEVGESILSIGGGDSQRWTISQTQSGKDAYLQQHIFVKPLQMDISTNLVVTTDRRSYHIEIQALPHVPYQALLSWKYPASMLLSYKPTEGVKEAKPSTPLSGLAQKQLNFNYHFVATERPSWMPRRVFDDGHKTYVELPESIQDTEAPIIYGLSSAKEQEVLNYRRYGNFYIIDHLIDTAELTIGGKVATKVGFEREVI